MKARIFLTGQFEASRARLRAVAYRMLGSLSEAEDAVQETWLRLSRVEAQAITNLDGWLTTAIARICLDMLRSRKTRREDPIDTYQSDPGGTGTDPEDEMAIADSVGLAMLVVLERLAPAERVAFVLHDMFAVPFDDIAPIVGRTAEATRQLASRARRRVQGPPMAAGASRARKRKVVQAFLAASRDGNFEALLSVLDPDVVFCADSAAARLGSVAEIHGAAAVAQAFKGRARSALPALVDGGFGVIVAPGGRLHIVLALGFKNDRIATIRAITDPDSLARLALAVLPD